MGSLRRRTRKKNLFQHFTAAEWRIAHLSNLEIKVFYSRAALRRMLALGRRGVTQYVVPSPRGWTFGDG